MIEQIKKAEKECMKCNKTKPMEDFVKSRTCKDGRENVCKRCHYIRGSELYRINKQKRLSQGKEWRARNKDKVYRYQANYRKNNPEKLRAARKLRYAISVGKIDRPERCDLCKNTGKIVAHHEDYSKPYDVLWLCEPCHNKRHTKNSLLPPHPAM